MASTEEPEEQRKSVAFTDEKTMLEADGSVTVEAADQADAEAGNGTAENDGLDMTLLKKKKKKKAKKAEDPASSDDDAEDKETEDKEEEEEGLDLTMLKKKKKKKAAATAAGPDGEDDFAKKLEALQLDEAAGVVTEPVSDQDGDMEAGTGIWAHDEDKPIKYDMLLKKFYTHLAERNPDYAQGSSRSMKIPPPQCLREGPKKTIFANIAEICKRLKRSEEHAASYLFAELGTNGSVDGSRRLVIKGRFQQKQIENVVRTYILEYVTCRTCRSPDTVMERGENRLHFVTCNSCGSRRSVQAIKTGFSAQVGKRKKMKP